MKSKKWHLPLIIVILFCLIAVSGFLVVSKVYSMYLTLCKKMDYSNNAIYSIYDFTEKTYQTSLREFSHYTFDYSWTEQTPPLVAHAFGGIDGCTYTNSLEAFEHNYALGHRVFEVDFDITDDEYMLIASHDKNRWLKKVASDNSQSFDYTHENFKSLPLDDRFSALDYRDVIDLMSQYPDIYVITDTKYTDQLTVLLQFAQIVKYAQETDISVLDRIIPQIYHPDMLSWVMSVYPFDSVIFTLYSFGNDPQAAYAFCEYSGIRFLTVNHEWITAESLSLWDQLGITVAAHTVNDPQQAQKLKDMGVDLIYTDYLTP